MTRRNAEAWTSTPGRMLTVRDVAEDPSGNHASGKGITVRTRVFPLGRASSLMAAGGPS